MIIIHYNPFRTDENSRCNAAAQTSTCSTGSVSSEWRLSTELALGRCGRTSEVSLNRFPLNPVIINPIETS